MAGAGLKESSDAQKAQKALERFLNEDLNSFKLFKSPGPLGKHFGLVMVQILQASV